MEPIGGVAVRHRDVRYAVFLGRTDGAQVTLTHLVLSTGQDFFGRFRRFEGQIINRKLQIHLPADFFNAQTE